jgi:hypothetical protein
LKSLVAVGEAILKPFMMLKDLFVDISTAIMNFLVAPLKAAMDAMQAMFDGMMAGWEMPKDGMSRASDWTADAYRNTQNIVTGEEKGRLEAAADLGINFVEAAAVLGNAITLGGAGWVGDKLANMMEFAEGGVVTKEVIGKVGEAGSEVVIPLDRFFGWLTNFEDKLVADLAAQDIRLKLTASAPKVPVYPHMKYYDRDDDDDEGGGGGGAPVTIQVPVTLQLDRRTITKTIVEVTNDDLKRAFGKPKSRFSGA